MMHMKLINPFKVDIPDELKTRKAKITYWFMWHLYLTDLGRGHVLGKFTQLFTEVSLLLLVLDKVGLARLSLLIIMVVSFIGAFLVWITGWFYQYHNIDKIQYLVTTRRNPMWKKIYDDSVSNNEKVHK